MPVLRVKFWLYGLLALLLLVLLTALLLPATTAGSRFLLGLVPGLEVQDFDGRLLGDWRAQHLAWQQDGQQVALAEFALSTDSACLLRMTLCIKDLKAKRLDLHFPPSEGASADSAPLSLPAIHLPLLALQVDALQLGSLWLNGDELLTDLDLRARWQGDSVQIERLAVRQQGRLAQASGELRMQGNWPLSARAQLALPAPQDSDWNLALSADGALQGSLAVQGESRGWLQADIKGKVQPLAGHLPLSLELSAQQLPPALLPDNLPSLQNIRVEAEGDLQAGFQVQSSAVLAAKEEKNRLSVHLQGVADTQQAQIERLQLSASDAQQLTLSGKVSWQDELTAALHLDAADFPWQLLYAPPQEVPLKLHQMQADVTYRKQQYQGQLAASLGGAGTDVQLETAFNGDFNQLSLQDLKLKTEAGGAQGRINLHFAGDLAWQLELALNRLDPSFWLAELPGQLSGTLHSQGKLDDHGLQGSAAFDLAGRLRGQSAALRMEAAGTPQHWQVSRLEAQLGNNRIHGKAGSADGQLQADLNLALSRLAQLWPQLSGSARGALQLHGALTEPRGRLQLSAEKLKWDAQSVEKLSLDINLPTEQGSLLLLASGIEAGGQAFAELQVEGKGDNSQQQLSLALRGQDLNAALALSGQYRERAGGWQWLGQVGRLQLAYGGQDWHLRAPAALARRADGALELAAHCLESGQASLCADSLQLLPQSRLVYRLQQFDLHSLGNWLPPNLALSGLLSGDFSLDLSAAQPVFALRLGNAGGSLRVKEQGKWLDLPWQDLTLNAQGNAQGIASTVEFHSTALGSLSADVHVNPYPAGKPVSGQWQLSGLDLALAQPFVPSIHHLRGKLGGSGRLSGSLLSPQVEADLRLEQGEIKGDTLPMELHALEFSARVRGEQMHLAGHWESGKQGRGEVSGQLHWAEDGLSGRVRLSAEALPMVYAPYAELYVFPDVTLDMADGRLSIDGTVRVPSGAIEIHSLPPTVVRPSADAVVAGREAEEGNHWKIGMNVTLEVGSEKVSFNGFGLQAQLGGRLHIGDNLSAQGELNLNGGRYRSYGQNLKVRRARLLFTGSLEQPFIDIEAVREVETVTAGLRISGLVEQPQTRIFSEPAMSDEQALSYLVLGKPLGSSGGSSDELLVQAALGLGLAGGEALGERIGQQLGISNLELGTSGSGAATQVVVKGTLAERLSLSYGVGLFEPHGTLALRYQLTKRLYLEAASSLASSLDLLYRRDF